MLYTAHGPGMRGVQQLDNPGEKSMHVQVSNSGSGRPPYKAGVNLGTSVLHAFSYLVLLNLPQTPCHFRVRLRDPRRGCYAYEHVRGWADSFAQAHRQPLEENN